MSKILNHTSDSGGATAVTGIYDQNEYLPEKRHALDAYALSLAEIVTGQKRANTVVSINAAKQ